MPQPKPARTPLPPRGSPAAVRVSESRWPEFRRWLQYFFPWGMVVVLLAGFWHRDEAHHDRERLASEQQAQVLRMADRISLTLRQVVADAVVLVEDGDLAALVGASGADAAVQAAYVARRWERTMRVKQVFDQIRWIDETGHERLRVNFQNGQTRRVSDAELQNKRGRYYFTEAMRLPRGAFFLSPLDLNIEGSAIEQPIKPMLRLATPVFDRQGKQRGVVVVNYLAADLLAQVRGGQQAFEVKTMMLNSAGYWLVGGGQADWAFMYGRAHTFGGDHPSVWAEMAARPNSQLRNEQGLWTWRTVYPTYEASRAVAAAIPGEAAVTEPHNANGFWRVVSWVPVSRIDAIQSEHMGKLLMVTLVALLFLMLGAWRMTVARQRAQVAEEDLRALNRSLEASVNERTKRLQLEVFDRQMAERRYRESAEQYQRMVATTKDGYWLLDDRGGFLDANPAACELLGYPRDVMLSLTVSDIDADGDPMGPLSEVLLNGFGRFEAHHRRADGRVVEVEVSAAYLPDFLRFICFVRDISALKEAERERRLAAEVMSNTEEAIFVVSPSCRILLVNPAFERATGLKADDVVGKSANAIELFVAGQDAKQTLVDKICAGKAWRAEMLGRRESGEVYPVWLSVSAVSDGQGGISSYVCVYSDITVIKESQQRLDFLAHHDALTQLPNRLLFQARLEHAVLRAQRDQRRLALFFIDLDHFKEVNDRFGHQSGDLLLCAVAEAMGERLRGEDTLARLGGDEFVVLLEQVGELNGQADVSAVLAKLEEVFPWPVLGDDGPAVEVTASIGVAFYPDDGDSTEALIKNADTAMYAAKQAGRAGHVYVSEMLADKLAGQDASERTPSATRQ